jgi:hypothetical protein
MTRIVDPIVADMQKEHGDASRAGQRGRARLIHLRGCASLACALAIQGVGRSQWNAAVRFATVSTLLIALVVITSTISGVVGWSAASHERLILLLVPAAFALAFPFGFAVLLLFGMKQRAASTPLATWVLSAALVCSAGSVLALGWIVPASNQAFREEAAGQPLSKGTNELTLSELRALVRSLHTAAHGGPSRQGVSGRPWSHRWSPPGCQTSECSSPPSR